MIKWKKPETFNDDWQFQTKKYTYSTVRPYDRKYYARRHRPEYPWFEDIDENGNPVPGCSQQGTTLKEAKRRCELLYKRRRPFHD